jgi:hypothetical protein
VMNPPVDPPPVVPPVNPPTSNPCNNQQTACVQGPDGTSFCYTVPRCTFFAATQAEADAIALSYAHNQATLQSFCVSGSLADCCIGTPYLSSFNVSGGTGPFVWTVVSGTLPTGLTAQILNNTRTLQISGNATGKGVFPITVRVEDPNGNFYERSATISSIGFGVTLPPDGEVDEPYSFQFTASGGTAPFVFSLNSGTLPPGLTISSTGLLSGTPTTGGQYDFIIRATDANGSHCERPCTVVIEQDCIIYTPSILPDGVVGVAYNTSLDANIGDVNPCYWKLVSGQMPPGLTIQLFGVTENCLGQIYGTPTTSGVYNFVISVEDESVPQRFCQKEFQITIPPGCVGGGLFSVAAATWDDVTHFFGDPVWTSSVNSYASGQLSEVALSRQTVGAGSNNVVHTIYCKSACNPHNFVPCGSGATVGHAGMNFCNTSNVDKQVSWTCRIFGNDWYAHNGPPTHEGQLGDCNNARIAFAKLHALGGDYSPGPGSLQVAGVIVNTNHQLTQTWDETISFTFTIRPGQSLMMYCELQNAQSENTAIITVNEL